MVLAPTVTTKVFDCVDHIIHNTYNTFYWIISFNMNFVFGFKMAQILLEQPPNYQNLTKHRTKSRQNSFNSKTHHQILWCCARVYPWTSPFLGLHNKSNKLCPVKQRVSFRMTQQYSKGVRSGQRWIQSLMRKQNLFPQTNSKIKIRILVHPNCAECPNL